MNRTAPAAPAEITDELVRRERQLHLPPPGSDAASIAEGVIDDYWEVGASGGRFGLDVITRVGLRRAVEPERGWVTREDECREIAPAVYLLTYLLDEPGRTTARSTLWRRDGHRWVAVYHQGTVAPPP